MQALKQAARENDAVRLEALCETWSLPTGPVEPDAASNESGASAGNSETEKAEGEQVNEISGVSRK
jgi:hypothetical protein